MEDGSNDGAAPAHPSQTLPTEEELDALQKKYPEGWLYAATEIQSSDSYAVSKSNSVILKALRKGKTAKQSERAGTKAFFDSCDGF